jgi:hypothetical protein
LPSALINSINPFESGRSISGDNIIFPDKDGSLILLLLFSLRASTIYAINSVYVATSVGIDSSIFITLSVAI